ncbi:CC137 protein, partial [Upupa epops]|nr:CC137 protein [Upupa epops]
GPGRKPGRPAPGSKPGPGQKPGPRQSLGPATGRDAAASRRPRSVTGRGSVGIGLATPRGPGSRCFRTALTPCSFCARKEKKMDNMKPKRPDEQEIPFRLRELMRSREAMKRPSARKRRRLAEKKKQQQQQQSKSKGSKEQGDIPVPKFRRGKGESERSYICRMEQEVQRILFLSKNQPQREPEKPPAPKSKRKKEFQNKKLEKARRKKEEKKEAMLERSRFQDAVAFGEVVTQPPTITSRPKGRGPVEKAGQKQLLLTSRLGQGSPAAPVMSMARRRIVEEERARVVRAYRDIQRRKQQQREVAQGGGSSTQAGRRVP